MINVYGYYSCGGYKDMYLGNSENSIASTYYLPLLALMKERNKPEEIEKIEYLEQLAQIKIITGEHHYAFPDECNVLFSHGGYAVIYKTLSDGNTCLSLKDVPNTDKDDLGRDIPFNILLIATDEKGKAKLENFALYVKDNYNESLCFLSKLFSYDYKVNGIKFDLPILIEKINSLSDTENNLLHINNHLIYLMLHSVSNIDIAFKEQNLNYNTVDCIVDTKGNIIKGDFLTDNNIEEITEFSTFNENDENVSSDDTFVDENKSISKNNTDEKKYSDDVKSFDNEITELKSIILNVSDKIDKLSQKTDENYKLLKEEIDRLINDIDNNKTSKLPIKRLLEKIKQYINK